jgi:repressor LexA
MDLTQKQQAVFDFLKAYRNQNGRPPSYEEIRQKFDFASLNSVSKHLQQLERKGFIRTPWGNQKRAMEIVAGREEAAAVTLPLLGTVVAGGPLEAAEIPEHIDVPEVLLRRGEHYALRVRGDSMVGDGIHDDDLLIVQRREAAQPGETVVALVEGEATVKRFYRQGERVELRPSNPNYSSIIVGEESVRIRGVVVALIRKFA